MNKAQVILIFLAGQVMSCPLAQQARKAKDTLIQAEEDCLQVKVYDNLDDIGVTHNAYLDEEIAQGGVGVWNLDDQITFYQAAVSANHLRATEGHNCFFGSMRPAVIAIVAL